MHGEELICSYEGTIVHKDRNRYTRKKLLMFAPFLQVHVNQTLWNLKISAVGSYSRPISFIGVYPACHR